MVNMVNIVTTGNTQDSTMGIDQSFLDSISCSKVYSKWFTPKVSIITVNNIQEYTV